MRRPRRRAPRQLLDITVRCQRSEFRLVPTPERRALLGFWLAKAQLRFPGVRILALCQLSNHVHLVVEDLRGEISGFMQLALGHFAKSINKLDRLRGAVFERRFAEIAILDEDALARRIAYAVNNPVEADLVRRHHDWLGLCLFSKDVPQKIPFTVFNESRYRKAREQADPERPVDRASFYETRELEIAALDSTLASKVAVAVDSREKDLRAAQRRVVGMTRVLRLSPFDRPKMSARSAMPLCFASTRAVRTAFAESWCAFVAAFRRASENFRAGVLDVSFPAFSFRPITASR